MKRTRILIPVIATAIFIYFSSLALWPTAPVQGRVVDGETGAPLAGVVVKMVLSEKPIVECINYDGGDGKCWSKPGKHVKTVKTSSDGEGQFSFGNLPFNYAAQLYPEKENYTESWSLKRRYSDKISNDFLVGAQTKNIIFRMTEYASISGILHDHEGAPLEGIQVALCGLPRFGGYSRDRNCWVCLEDTCQTKADGSFQIQKIGPGDYYLSVDPVVHKEPDGSSVKSSSFFSAGGKVKMYPIINDGWTPSMDAKGQAVGYPILRYPAKDGTTFSLKSAEHKRVELQFPLVSLYHITGKADDSAFSSVIHNQYGEKLFYNPYVDLNTNHFDVWLPAGTYSIASDYTGVGDGTDKGYAGEIAFQVIDKDISDLELKFGNEKYITVPIHTKVNMVCGEDSPFCDIDPWLIYFDKITPYRYGPKIEAEDENERGDGEWTVKLLPGTYRIEMRTTHNTYPKSIMSGDTDLSQSPFVLTRAEKPKPIQIILEKGASVEGALLKDSKEVVGAWVYVLPKQYNSLSFSPQSHEKNYFIQGLPPGEYLIFASETELSLDEYNPKLTETWKDKGKEISLKAGEALKLDLPVIE